MTGLEKIKSQILDEAKAARCVSKRMTGSEKIDAGKSLGIKSCEKNTESEKTGAPWSGRDWCMAAGLTVLFAVMAFVNLGSMKAPQRMNLKKMIATEMRWCFGLMEV